ncbi:hypothetical protein DUT90_12740 [Polaribacter sp. WD7]|uniref:hypothetical protein n=1 Tax=Polaribacter sp. WD7 TaxID=2269061 RepID=UPI000DF449DF|nr:hypothetical protein [Polaribacter sp. WD7]RCS26610.1 hypothetical protein DUT90_12740 [Polaribacter sp. WD7]
MFLRILFFLCALIFITSCDKFSFSKKESRQAIDTIVDFSSVDTYPSFKICDSIINKDRKANCFRTTVHQKIGKELAYYKLTTKDSINAVVTVAIIINSKGEFQLESIESSENIKNQIPKLDSLLKVSIKNLPKIYPAIKRGIPVTTKYQLPVRIQLRE